MTSSNGNLFHVTGLLCGEFTGHRWIPHTKAGDAELWGPVFHVHSLIANNAVVCKLRCTQRIYSKFVAIALLLIYITVGYYDSYSFIVDRHPSYWNITFSAYVCLYPVSNIIFGSSHDLTTAIFFTEFQMERLVLYVVCAKSVVGRYLYRH